MPKFIARANRIVTVSHSTRDDISKNFPSASSKTTTIYNGVRSAATNLSAKPLDRSLSLSDPYFITISSIHPRKNVGGLLDGFAEFKVHDQQSTKLVIVGRMAWKTSDVYQKYQQHPYKKDIILTGYLSDGEMFDLLRRSVALIYVSLFEGFGLPIVEAMHNGVPVITSNRSSMQEISGDAALLVDPESPKEISTAMRRVLDEPDLQSYLIERGHNRSKIFKWSNAVKALRQIIQDL